MVEVLNTQSLIEIDPDTRFMACVWYSHDTDQLNISFHKETKKTTVTSSVVVWPEYGDTSLVTSHSEPGCIMNAVQLLKHGQTGEVSGIQFSTISSDEFPISPEGKTLLGYIDMLAHFPGFEKVICLVKSIGLGEDFLSAVRIDVTIPRAKKALAA